MRSTENFIHRIIEDHLRSGGKAIRTRFSPEPSGYLHLGHAKSALLNLDISRRYGGTCNLRMDDTNPSGESAEYTRAIEDDLRWLGFAWDGRVRYSSDYFDMMYNYATELIENRLAYVDQLSREQTRDHRGGWKNPGRNSPYRERGVRENLEMFDRMRNGGFGEGEACLRAKIDMSSPSMVMRDPVLYRIKFSRHHRTGNSWCVYPTYDFAHCISDAIEEITHSLCTLEFQENRILYDWILSNISIPHHPKQCEFSRLNVDYTVMSKRKLSILIDRKIVDGWDDPRIPTISGLRRKGYTARSIADFSRRIGVTRKDSSVSIDILDACLRSELNRTAPRIMAVMNPLRVIIESLPTGYVQQLNLPRNPNDLGLGTRGVTFSREIYIDSNDFLLEYSRNFRRLILGGEVRLRGSFVIKAIGVDRDKDGNVRSVRCTHDPSTMNRNPEDGRKIGGVIHWVSAVHHLEAEFHLYERLFDSERPVVREDLVYEINPNSKTIVRGVVETGILEFDSEESHFQFEREGYFRRDTRSEVDRMTFSRIARLNKSPDDPTR